MGLHTSGISPLYHLFDLVAAEVWAFALHRESDHPSDFPFGRAAMLSLVGLAEIRNGAADCVPSSNIRHQLGEETTVEDVSEKGLLFGSRLGKLWHQLGITE